MLQGTTKYGSKGVKEQLQESAKNLKELSKTLKNLGISKVTERIVRNLLIEYLEKYEVILDHKSGFRSEYSVNTCPAHLFNQILKGFEAKKYSMIYKKPLTPLIIKFF